MPLISRLGAASSRGFGEFNQQAQGNYIENYFSTNLYTGNGGGQQINSGVALSSTDAWKTYVYSSTAGFPDVTSTTVDSSGNLYAVGAFSNSGYLMKQSSNGAILWQRRLIDLSTTFINDVAVSSSGNVYVAGGATPSSGTNYSFVAKYDSTGAIQWKKSLADPTYNSRFTSIYIDSSENVYVTGYSSQPRAIIAKYNSSGTLQWQRMYTITNSYGYGIVADASGNVYVAGEAVDSPAKTIAYLVKYDSSGTLLWQRRLADSTSGNGYNLAIDASDNLYICGSGNDGTRQIGILAKYNSSGTIQWQRKFYKEYTYALGITLDASGNVYLNGYVIGSPSLYGIVLKYNSSGTLQWQNEYYSTGLNTGKPSVDSSNNLYVPSWASSSSVGYVMVLPTGSSSLSGYAGVSLFAGGMTEAAGTATSGTPSGTSSTTTWTNANATSLTDSAGTNTVATQTQNAVVSSGGLVWFKGRSGATDHALYDTARGATFDLVSNSTAAQTTQSTGLTAFSASGFAIGSLAKLNTNNAIYAAWTFREQPKFFDIVTYTGNGSTANRAITHGLGSVPGMIIVKRSTGGTSGWIVYHRSLSSGNNLELNTTSASSGNGYWSVAPTAADFTLSGMFGAGEPLNQSGSTYVAYLFAHDAGGFGVDGSQNVISCGSFTTDAGGAATINLGWEPQFIIYKPTSLAGGWFMSDSMRGFTVNSATARLSPNTSGAEDAGSTSYTGILQNGFTINSSFAGTQFTGIYLAIRRGPMAVPTDATKVFKPTVYTGTNVDNRLVNTTIAPDMVLVRQRNSNTVGGMVVGDRMRGQPYLLTGTTAAEVNDADAFDEQLLSAVPYGTAFSSMNGVWVGNDATAQLNANTSANNHIAEAFKRAPGFMDCVCYTGTGTSMAVKHNLGVTPELMVVKKRSNTGPWSVYSSAITYSNTLFLNTTAAADWPNAGWTQDPDASSFYVYNFGTSALVTAGDTYVTYLFATCPGVSKVGSYTGTGTTKQINCGFTAGARFVLIKRTDSTGDWYVYDSARGIVAGNDPYILLNSTSAEVTSSDFVDAFSAGFELSSTAPAGLNANGGTYIFLAIA